QENAAKIPSLAKDVPKELTIDGKPYSQYKAEQDALKKQQEANKQTVTQSLKEISINAADQKPVPVKVQPVVSKPSNGAMVDDGQTDLLKAAFERSKTVATTKEPVVQKPVINEQQPDIKTGETLPATPAMMSIPKPVISSANTVNNDITANKQVETQKPQVPDQFKLSASGTWTNKPVDDKSVVNKSIVESPIPQDGGAGNFSAKTQTAGIDPSSKQSPSNFVVTEDKKAIKESKMIREIPVVQEKEPVTQKPDATSTKTTQPQVPEQFKLQQTNKTWDAKSVTENIKQPVIQTEQQKLPEVKVVKEDATPKTTTTSNQAVPAEKQPSSTDTNLPLKKQN
ncbi:MAG TPA: hypothetical protein VIV35_07335, partial [Chitinophagaceae bacterium]